jgi:hypothetical protein
MAGSPRDLARLAIRYAGALLEERRGIPRRVEAIAARHGVPVRKLTTVNDAAFRRRLRDRSVDVLLSPPRSLGLQPFEPPLES